MNNYEKFISKQQKYIRKISIYSTLALCFLDLRSKLGFLRFSKYINKTEAEQNILYKKSNFSFNVVLLFM
jgi:hypothetical protein